MLRSVNLSCSAMAGCPVKSPNRGASCAVLRSVHYASASRRAIAQVQACRSEKPAKSRQSKEIWGLIAAGSILAGAAGPAMAVDRVAEFTASGLIFKDSVEVLAVEDTQVEGVTVYLSDFRRSLTDKLAKDFFNEPSQASIFCSRTAPEIKIKDIDAIKGMDGNEIFAQQKNLNFFQNKTLRVRRVYDEDRRTLLYIAYSTKISSGNNELGASRYKTSGCAIPLTVRESPGAAGALE